MTKKETTMDLTQTSAPASPARLPFSVSNLAAKLRDLALRLKIHLFPLPGQELENYLAGSVDLVDLEHRLNDWERRRTRTGRYV